MDYPYDPLHVSEINHVNSDLIELLARQLVESKGGTWETYYSAGTDEQYMHQFLDKDGNRWILIDDLTAYTAYKGMTGDQYWGYDLLDGEEGDEDDTRDLYDGPINWQSRGFRENELNDAPGEFSLYSYLAHLGALHVFLHDLEAGLVLGHGPTVTDRVIEDD